MAQAPAMKFNITTEAKDGSETTQEVTVRIADLARYDIVRNRNGFPSQEEGSFLFMVLVSYCALTRTGKIVNVKVEDFIDTVVTIEPVEAPEEEAEAPKSE